jgi:NAD(P)H-nitrite reductase large subunit
MTEENNENVECGCEIRAEDWDLIICRCEEVTRGDILTAINEGARTVEEVKRRTRAGMGLCQSKTCYRSVRAILSEVTGQPQSEILPFTTRPPLRPMTIRQLASLDEGDGQ